MDVVTATGSYMEVAQGAEVAPNPQEFAEATVTATGEDTATGTQKEVVQGTEGAQNPEESGKWKIK